MIEIILLWIVGTLSVATFIAFLGEKHGTGIIIGAFASLVVIAQVLANKTVTFYGLTAPGGILVYATSYLLTDILSEFHGKKKAQEAVWAGFLGSILLVVSIQIAIEWPSASFWGLQEAFESTLGTTWRIVTASLVAYLISQNWDINVFHYLKELTEGKHLWLRNLVSTITSHALDSVIFITIAFYGLQPLIPLIIGQFVIKLIIAAMDTPFLYSIKELKKREYMD